MRAKTIIGKLLLAFLLVSIGVAIGKEMGGRKAPPATQPVATGGDSRVVVYYMHGIPCVTCTFIETTTEHMVREEFGQAVAAGCMAFVSVNYLDPANANLADTYNVGENMVIAARFEDGKQVNHVRMDGVMQLASDAEQLKAYVRRGIQTALEGGQQ